jgi:hypothetical protein
MDEAFDLNAFGADVDSTLKNGRQTFQGIYQNAIDELAGLSPDEKAMIVPDITSQQKYQELILVVQEASKNNVAQAELKQRIENLGSVAVGMAKKITSLAGLFLV